MKYSLAGALGGLTFLTASFAALRFLAGSPDAMVGVIILGVAVHAVIFDWVDQRGRVVNRGRRVV